MTQEQKTILVCGEHLTPSHVMRPLRLAQALSSHGESYKVYFAAPELPTGMQDVESLSFHTLPSPAASILKKRVDRVLLPLYTTREISKMVEAECSLIQNIKPDLIIHDFRNTLAISSQIMSVPLIGLNDFYWNRAYLNTHIMPDTPLGYIVGHARARSLSKFGAPLVESAHIIPFNTVARRYGLVPFHNLRHLYNSCLEQWLFDIPEVLPNADTSHTRFLGPLIWEHEGNVPEWLSEIDDHSALCVTFSSSGARFGVERIIDSLQGFNFPLIVLTAGKYTIPSRPGVYVTDFLPLRAVLAKSRMLICHGGSSLVYHALAASLPVIGIPQNITQWYSMHQFADMGIGMLLPPEKAHGYVLQEAVLSSIADTTYAVRTCIYRESCVSYDPLVQIKTEVDRWFAEEALLH